MSTQEEKLGIFYQLSKAVAFISDPHGLERHLIDLLKQLISCNSILVFHNDRQQHKLTAHNPYNLSQTDEQSVAISYDEPFISDVLVLRKSVSRFNPQRPVLPSMKAELFVPLISPDDVLGCLYLSRVHANGFESNDITLLEHAAGHLTFALERQEWKRHFRKLEETNLTWQDKYVAFLQAIPYPAAVVDVVNDRFDEVNDAALTLFGHSEDYFIQTPFSALCSIKKADDGSETRVAVIKKQNDSEKCTVTENTYVDGGYKKSLFIFFPKHVTLLERHDKWLRTFFQTCVTAPIPNDLQSDLDPIVTALAEQFSASYITLLRGNSQGKLVSLAAFDFNDKFHKASRQKSKQLQEGLFDHVLQLKKPVFIDDVKSEPAFDRWIAIAERLDYRSMVSIPLISANEIVALLNVFSPKLQEWDQNAFVLTQAASYITPLIKLHVLTRDYKSQEKHHLVVNKISRLLSCDTESNKQIQDVANELYTHIPFDYFSITQFNEETGIPVSYVLGTEAMSGHLDTGRWEAIENSPLGWVMLSKNAAPVREDSDEGQALPYRLPASFSILLMYENNYIGNMALGRLQKQTFEPNERAILRELGTHLARAIYTRERLALSKRKEKHIRSLNEFCLCIDSDVEGKDVFQHLNEMAGNFFQIPHFVALKYYENLDVEEIFSFLPQAVLECAVKAKAHDFFADLAKAPKPVCIKTSMEFADFFCESLLFEEGEFQPFIIAPVMHENRLFGYIMFDWLQELSFDEYSNVVITPLVHHIQQALHKSKLYSDLDKKADDLELLMSTISHDFKTPIQNLRSFVTMLSDKYGDYLPEEPQKYLLRILTNIDNMEVLVEDLLKLYRVGELRQFKQVRVKDIIEVALSSVDQIIEEHDIKIISSEEWPEVYGNPSTLLQIFTNLISNAAKFVLHESNPTIEIGYRPDGKLIEFYVRDNGPGIKPSLHDKIFELFYKGKDSQNSTGIGLAIVKRAVQSHGGSVWVESREGGGATFKFVVPKFSEN